MPRSALLPGSTVGILGGGQLGRLLAISAAKLGLKTIVYAPEEDSPAFQVASAHYRAAYDDEAHLRAFAKACDVITFEFENVPADTLRIAGAHSIVRPSPVAAEVAQDRIAEKRFLSSLGIPIAPYAPIGSRDDLEQARAFLSRAGKGLLKRSREGYDGKGQKRVSTRDELDAAFGEFDAPCVLEGIVRFSAELSVIAVRPAEGEMLCYDVPENTHRGGVLRTSKVPASIPSGVQSAAQTIARKIASALDYVGVLGVELFLVPEGGANRLLVNEIAPRVHNSGHWTLDACVVSQFENHIRAIAGWPLGGTERHSNALMTNLLGSDVVGWREILLRDPHASLYLYGKTDVREGRKLGHVTQITPREKK